MPLRPLQPPLYVGYCQAGALLCESQVSGPVLPLTFCVTLDRLLGDALSTLFIEVL